MAYSQTLASSFTAPAPSGVQNGVPFVVWTSDDIAQGSQYKAVRVLIEYESISPDTDVVSPFDFSIAAVIEQENADGSWSELGRQFSPIRKLETGAKREILVSPAVNSEEGIDQAIAGFNGVAYLLKSKTEGGAEGKLRVVLIAQEGDVNGPNPFQSVTFSAQAHRFDPS